MNSAYFSDVKAYLGNLIKKSNTKQGYLVGTLKAYIYNKSNKIIASIVFANIIINLIFFILLGIVYFK